MFALRCLGVSLSFLLVVVRRSSVVVVRSWRLARRAGKHLSARRLSDLLFILRGLPLMAAALLTPVVPSFLPLDRGLCSKLLAVISFFMGVFCLLLRGAGVANAITTHRKTSRRVDGWMRGATEASGGHRFPYSAFALPRPRSRSLDFEFPVCCCRRAAAAAPTNRELGMHRATNWFTYIVATTSVRIFPALRPTRDDRLGIRHGPRPLRPPPCPA